MSYQTTTCIVIACNSCGMAYRDEEATVHFDSEADAGEAAADSDWWVTPETAWCEGCREKVAHEHIWDDEACVICWKDVEDAE